MDTVWAKALVMKYGYLAVLMGSLVEGETVIIAAAFCASQNLLSITAVLAISFLGSMFSDQLLFQLGRHYQGFVKRTHLGAVGKVKNKIARLLKTKPDWLLFTFRFIPGIRVATPIVVGMHDFSVKRFTIINIIAAAIWAVTMCGFGYFAGVYAQDQTSIVQYIIIGMAAIAYMGLIYTISRV